MNFARQMAVAALVGLFGIGMCAFLSYFKFESALDSAARSRMTVPAASVREGVEAVLALGLPLEGANEAPALLARERAADPEIVQISISDMHGHVLFNSGSEQVRSDQGVLRMPVRNSFDLQLGHVQVRYSQASSQRALKDMRLRLMMISAAGWVLTLLLVGGALRLVRARAGLNILIAVMIGMLAVSWATLRAFEAGLRPELLAKAAVVGGSLGELTSKALAHGLVLQELVGVQEHLRVLRVEHPELAYLALRDARGAVLFESGEAEERAGVEVPILQGGALRGVIQAQVSARYIQSILLESGLDLAVVFIVAVFLTRELLHGIDTSNASGAVCESAHTLARLRVPLFLFMLAEELTRALLPGYARALMPAGTQASPELLMGLPIVIFMAVVAFGQPVLAPWSERTGHRRVLLWGASLGVIGLSGSALASGLAAFIAWRALCGLGYAMVFVAGQGLVIAHTTPAERTRGFALFVGAIMVAAVCGPPIGGILADHLGPRGGFAFAALTAGAAWIAVRGLPREGAQQLAGVGSALSARDFARLFKQVRFLRVAVLAALPAKLLLAGFCFYLVPVYAIALGAPPSVAGRAMMLYAVVLVLVLPQATRWVEAGVPLSRLVGWGLCLSSLGGFALLCWRGILPLYGVTALLGLGQGMSIAAQSSLLAQLCAPEITAHGSGPVFGAYRLVERLGNTCGPLLAAGLVALIGHAAAFVALAALVLACGLLFLLLSSRSQA